jgi:hypothetical protein
MNRMIFDTLNGILLLHRIRLYSSGACVNVESVASVEGGFGHEEDDEEEHDDEGTAHCMHCDPERAVLDDGSS